MSFLNRFHDLLMRKVVLLTETVMVGNGWGAPPAEYAFLAFGSGGRREMTLWSDQDNGLIYEDVEESFRDAVERYFAAFAGSLVASLEKVGYPPCEGNVLSTNPQWRKPLSAWIRMIAEWFGEPDWENVRYLLITADFRCVCGQEKLLDQLKEVYFNYVKSRRSIILHMLHNTLHHKISLGVFGQLIKERYGQDAGGVDVKYGAYIPFVNGVRLLAVQHHIRRSSTLDRLNALSEANILPAQLSRELLQAWSSAVKFREMTPYQEENGVFRTRGKLAANQLTKEIVQELKSCLKTGAEFQRYILKIGEEIRLYEKWRR